MGPLQWIKNRFGSPGRSPSDYFYDPDIAPEEKRQRIEGQMGDIRTRLEALKTQVDVEGRRTRKEIRRKDG